jgi:DNA-binding CsgD family transcriptional regulator
VFDEPFFDLTAAIHNAADYGELADFIGKSLPSLIGADVALVLNFVSTGALESILGNREVSNRLAVEGAVYGSISSSVMASIDPGNPRQRGLSLHDESLAGNSRLRDFVALIEPGHGCGDAFFGAVCHCQSRASILLATKRSGRFTREDRDLFDIMLFTARAAARRIAMTNVETQVRKFHLSCPPSAPNAWFIVHPNSEVLPFNYEAIQLAERWWSQDEAFHELGKEKYEALRNALTRAWKDPLIAEFAPVELDLGGGSMCFHGLPRHDGEIILLQSAHARAARGEAMLSSLLTKRQQEIMNWIAEGKTSAEVAIILEISPRTVEKHLEAVFQRLGVENRIAAVRRYLDLKAGDI